MAKFSLPMKKLLFLLLLVSGIASAQYTPTGSKTRWINGVGLSSTRDTSLFTSAADTNIVTTWNGNIYWKGTGYWNKIGHSTNVGAQIHDSLYAVYQLKAGTSAGARLVSNSGTVISEWGLGGSANMDFHGFAGYDANRASSYTARSFTDKNYVDSSSRMYVNVMAFGAIPNDGTNDATAIRTAINYAYNNGYSTVYFPAGVYTSTEDSIGIRSGLRYLGYGATIQQVTSNTCIFLSRVAVSNVTFEGLTLLGKGTDYTGGTSYTPYRPVGIFIGFTTDTSTNIRIVNCNIKNFAYAGISIAYGKDVWVENNKLVGYSGVAAGDINNFGVDINNGNRRVTVIGNHIDSAAQGVLVQGNVWEYSIIGNVITNIIGQHGIYASSGWNSVISGNSIKNCVNNGILLQLTSGQLRGIENVVVNGNTIDSAAGYGIYAYRISGTDQLRNISITNNIIRGKLQTTGAGVELSYCEGGTVSGNYTNGYAYSLLMQSDKYINVSNHAGYNSNENGLYISADTTRQLTFDNVRFINPSRGGSNAYGILVNDGSNLTFNNAFVSDSTATMTYSLYIQPNADQTTIRVNNSLFLNAAVRFESSLAIKEFSNNLAASYYNSPASITDSRTAFAAIGSTPNANGASVSGSTITLQPASASYGGIVTTGTQTIAGAKTFSSQIATIQRYNDMSRTTVNGSTSGAIYAAQIERGNAHKKVIIYCDALVGTATYTFPVAFIATPVVLQTNGLSYTVATSVSTTAVTITGPATGILILEGF